MSDSAKQNVVSLEDYGQSTRGLGSSACTQALRAVCKLVEDRLALNFSNTMGKIDDALFGRAEMAESSMLQAEYHHAMQTLRSIRKDVEAAFISHFRNQFNRGIPRQPQFGDSFILTSDSIGCGGVSQHNANSEENRAIANMVHQSREDCAQLLLALDKRIGFLMHDPDLEQWQNPLSPEAICAAFQAATSVIETGLEIRLMMYKQFDQCVISNLDELYKELNQQLVRMGVIADIRGTLNSNTGAATDSVAALTSAPAQTPAPVPTSAGQQTGADRPASSQSGDMTIDIVAMLFDYILNDRSIPVSMRALLGRLQIPLVKVAMLEHEFFSKKSHPARQLLNTLAATAMGWDAQQGHEDPSYRKVEAIVQTIVDEFETDTSLFKTLLIDLEAFIDAEKQQAGIQAERSVKVQQGQERLDSAQSTTMLEIEPRLRDQKNLEFVREFISTHWKNLLVITTARQGKNSDTWNRVMSTMDDLIWSVKPKNTDQERQRLAAMQPNLLNNIRKGMKRLSVTPGETEAFIARLVDAHGHTLTGYAATEQETAIREQTIIQSGQADGQAMTGKKQPDSRADADYTSEVQQLSTGTWMEFLTTAGKVTQAKLSWVSPINNTYLFTDQRGLKTGTYTFEELADLLRCARANILNTAPSMDNAVNSVPENDNKDC